MRNNKTNYMDLYNKSDMQEKTDIPSTVSKVRDLVKSFNNGKIKTEELDLPDKYTITIEIMKDA